MAGSFFFFHWAHLWTFFEIPLSKEILIFNARVLSNLTLLDIQWPHFLKALLGTCEILSPWEQISMCSLQRLETAISMKLQAEIRQKNSQRLVWRNMTLLHCWSLNLWLVSVANGRQPECPMRIPEGRRNVLLSFHISLYIITYLLQLLLTYCTPSLKIVFVFICLFVGMFCWGGGVAHIPSAQTTMSCYWEITIYCPASLP